MTTSTEDQCGYCGQSVLGHPFEISGGVMYHRTCTSSPQTTISAIIEAELRGYKRGIEDAAEVAGRDERTDLARTHNHEPDWYKYGKQIAAAIRKLGD